MSMDALTVNKKHGSTCSWTVRHSAVQVTEQFRTHFRYETNTSMLDFSSKLYEITHYITWYVYRKNILVPAPKNIFIVEYFPEMKSVCTFVSQNWCFTLLYSLYGNY